MFEMIIASAAGFWLGLYLLVAFGSLLWASNTDSFFMGLAVIAIAWAVGEFIFSIPILASLVANPFLGIVYIGLYGAFGALYTRMWKLPNFIKKNSNNIQSSYNHWKDIRSRQSDKARGMIQGEKEDNPQVDVSFETFLNSDSYKYSVRNNKDRVASWVLLWPTSLLWELSHKPFVWLWEQVYYGLGRVFEKANHDMARKVLEQNKK